VLAWTDCKSSVNGGGRTKAVSWAAAATMFAEASKTTGSIRAASLSLENGWFSGGKDTFRAAQLSSMCLTESFTIFARARRSSIAEWSCSGGIAGAGLQCRWQK